MSEWIAIRPRSIDRAERSRHTGALRVRCAACHRWATQRTPNPLRWPGGYILWSRPSDERPKKDQFCCGRLVCENRLMGWPDRTPRKGRVFRVVLEKTGQLSYVPAS